MIRFLTIIAVSVDAYLAGLAYNLGRKLKLAEVLYASSFTFFVCCLAFCLNAAYVENLPFLKEAGAAIYVLIGARNYLGESEGGLLPRAKSQGGLWLLGLAVSADAGLASLTIELASSAEIPINAFYMFSAHFFFLLLGTLSVKFMGAIKFAARLSGVFLIGLGLVKLVL